MTPSPCTTCISDAPCPCPAFMVWEDSTHPEPKPCLVCVEVDHFTLGGDDLWFVASRLGMQHASLLRHLERHNHPAAPKRVPA